MSNETKQQEQIEDLVDTCGGVPMPEAKNPNGHYECENEKWVWYDDIG